jgi:hypothetical protein
MSDPVTVKLSRAITVIGREFDQLQFREPVGNDLVECGMTGVTSADGTTKLDPAAMGKLIGKLAGIPAASVGLLPVRDWIACAAAVSSFFADTPSSSSSTDTSTAADGGAAVA